jgi:uncharacterized membrane protein
MPKLRLDSMAVAIICALYLVLTLILPVCYVTVVSIDSGFAIF